MGRVLPKHPDIQRIKKDAKRLLRSYRADNSDEAATDALDFVSRFHPKPNAFSGLRDAQLAIARSYGFRDWKGLKSGVEVARINAMSVLERATNFVRMGCVQYQGADQAVSYERAARLLEHSPKIMGFDLSSAVVSHNAELVEDLIKSNRDAVHQPVGPLNWPPLLYATYSRVREDTGESGSVEIVKMLLEHGADPNAHTLLNDVYRFTALTGAMGEGELGPENQPPHQYAKTIATLLLEAGANPNDGQGLYNTMFKENSSSWLRILVDYGLNAQHRINWDQKATAPTCFDFLLGHAAKNNLVDRIEMLLGLGADVNFVDGYERRPVYSLALLKGHKEAALALAEHGAKVEQMSPEDEIRIAISSGDAEGVQAMLRQVPTLIHVTDLMHHAFRHGPTSMLWDLLSYGFDIDGTDAAGLTLMHLAAWEDNIHIVKQLKDAGARTDIRDVHHDSTPLGHAAFNGAMRVVAFLADASEDLRDPIGCARAGRAAELLDADPASLNYRGPEGHTLIHLVGIWLDEDADDESCAQILDDLINRGLSVNTPSNDGKTPLDLAISRGNLEMAEMLEARGGLRAT